MSEFKIASVRELAHVLTNLKDATRHLGPMNLTWDYAALVVDMLEAASAEQLLVAFRNALLPDHAAKTVVGVLLEAGLTLDKTLDDMGGELGGTDAR